MDYTGAILIAHSLSQASALIDLRLVCSDRADYANPIEPSGPGGMKIATAIVRAIAVRPAGDYSAVLFSRVRLVPPTGTMALPFPARATRSCVAPS